MLSTGSENRDLNDTSRNWARASTTHPPQKAGARKPSWRQSRGPSLPWTQPISARQQTEAMMRTYHGTASALPIGGRFVEPGIEPDTRCLAVHSYVLPCERGRHRYSGLRPSSYIGEERVTRLPSQRRMHTLMSCFKSIYLAGQQRVGQQSELAARSTPSSREAPGPRRCCSMQCNK